MTYAITLSSSTSGLHFPIVAVSYGYVATMLGVQIRNSIFRTPPLAIMNANATLRLRGKTADSYLYNDESGTAA